MIRLCLWVRQLALRVLGIASRQDIADMRRALAMLASELRRSTATKYKAQERGLALVPRRSGSDRFTRRPSRAWRAADTRGPSSCGPRSTVNNQLMPACSALRRCSQQRPR